MTFELEGFYREQLALAYTSVDRIYVRGYVPILQTCGGFRTWAERLRPDEPVTNSWIKSWARRFHQNVKRFAEEHDIPIVKPNKGQRRHLLAAEYREESPGEEGVYLILKGFERAPDSGASSTDGSSARRSTSVSTVPRSTGQCSMTPTPQSNVHSTACPWRSPYGGPPDTGR